MNLKSQQNNTHATDIAIVGAGPCGLFAAFQAGMLGMQSTIIDCLSEVGGQCTALYPQKPIYDIPAYPIITGSSLVENLLKQIEPFSPHFVLNSYATAITQTENEVEIQTSSGQNISAKSLIIAAGAGAFGPNRPPIDKITDYENKSIFYSVLDTGRFKDKTVVIAGGGDSALDWCIELSKIAKKVYLVHRRAKFRGMDESINKIKHIAEQTQKIELVIPYQLHSLSGKNGMLTSVTVSDLDNNQKTLETDFLLPFFGLKTDLGALKNWGFETEGNTLITNPASMETNIKKIYAIGDVAQYPGKLKLILTGFSEAALSIHSAYKYVFPDKPLHFEYSTTKGIK